MKSATAPAHRNQLFSYALRNSSTRHETGSPSEHPKVLLVRVAFTNHDAAQTDGIRDISILVFFNDDLDRLTAARP